MSQALTTDLVGALEPMATPLAVVFVGLVIWRQLRSDVQPIFIGIVKGLTVTAQSNALYFAMLIICGFNAGFPVMANLAAKFHWPMIEAGATFAAAVCSAVLPFMIKPPPTSFTAPEIKGTASPELPPKTS